MDWLSLLDRRVWVGGEVAFKKVPRIRVRSGQEQHFPLEVKNGGWEALLTYSSTFQSDE